VGFVQTNLASNQASVVNPPNPDLQNPWGLAATGTSPWWLGLNGTGLSELYNGAGVKQALTVTIQGDGSVTGVVASGVAGSFNGDAFLFASEDGTFSGWRGALGTTAEVLATGSTDNVYKGIAASNISGNAYAYLANFRSGAIDVKKGNPAAPNLTGSFLDPNLPAGYAPFGIQRIGSVIYVTYALQDGAKLDDVPGVGNGYVDAFGLQGNFIQRLVSQGDLNSPWGLALAPADFGDFGGDLLVGNFGDGLIHAYNPTTGAPAGVLLDTTGNPLAIEGLWALQFGNGAAAGPTNRLFFTAGPNDEADGVFGVLVAAPEPGTCLIMAGGLALLIARRRCN
jgi:uncharacterized protein (TIGR03118 family)